MKKVLLALALGAAVPASARAFAPMTVPCVGSFLSTRTATNQVEWNALWSLTVGLRAAPSVDFSKDVVVMRAADGRCTFTTVPKSLAPAYKPTLVLKNPLKLASPESPGLFDGSAPSEAPPVDTGFAARIKRLDRSADTYDPNAVLKDHEPVDPDHESKLMLSVQNLNFMKNNEYFNQFADGYTLFGYQLRPTLVYYPNRYTRVAGGAYLMKEFGRDGFTTTQPYFNIKLAKNGYTGTFGNLEGSINHDLIDPIYDFERVLTSRQEYGIQFQADKKHWNADVWMDWQRAIHRNDPYNEMFTFGVSGRAKLPAKKSGWSVSLPVQMLLWHQGGQIQSDDKPQTEPQAKTTILNAAGGISIQQTLPKGGFVKAARVEGYGAYYKDLVQENSSQYWQGSGVYATGYLATKLVDASLSYWNGSGWIAPEGAAFYQSVSRVEPGVHQKHRGLLIGRLSRAQKIGRNVTFEARFEPYYDLQKKQLDYSYGLYLVYSMQEYLARAKH